MRIQQVTQILTEAIAYYQDLRDHPQTDSNLSYGECEKTGRRLIYFITIEPPNYNVTPQNCVEAATYAYSKAHLIQLMVEDRQMWADATKRDGSHLQELVALLDRPDGDLLAMQELFRRQPRD